MADTKKSETIETVSKAEFDKVVAERDKYARAVNTLINTMAQRYAQDLLREVLADK